MKLSEVKNTLSTLDKVSFKLESGDFVPEHFHVTEIGMVHKHFIDCGGTIRHEKLVNFQLWTTDDYDHRLKADKLSQIILLSEEKLGIEDAEVEVEYQSRTIGKYNLSFDGTNFVLMNKKTACLATDACGIPSEIERRKETSSACCSPTSKCC